MEVTARQERLTAARLYAITPEAERASVERVVAAWLRGGVDVVQLRQKRMARGPLLDLAIALAATCAAAGALFVVNDHVDVAVLSGADGVHVGPDDLTVGAARRAAGPKAAKAAVRAPAKAISSVRYGTKPPLRTAW